MSKNIINILENYEDFELAFLRKYKINTYLTNTQKEILEYLEKRGITTEKSDLLIKEIKNKQFIDNDYRCPRCKSKKIKKETIELTNLTSQSSALDGLIGKSEFGEREICEICGLWINDPNGEKPQKKNLLERMFNKIKKQVIIILIFPIFFFSCSSISTLIKQEDRIELTESNISNIEGFYQNSNDSINIWRLLKPFPKVKEFKTLHDSLNIVKVELVDNKKIKFLLYVNDTIYQTKNIKYTLKNGVIMIKCTKNMRYWGIPLIAFQHACENVNIGIDKENNLVVAHTGKASGGVFIIVFGTETSGYGKLKRIDKDE